ncbi:MAG TPA: hypothetical protein VFN80_04520 [Acidothermaceae bacterium]|nr:hypothetical protein [Acidothermaceae bacterium]
MTEPRPDDGALEPVEPASLTALEPPPPGGRSELAPMSASGQLPAVPGHPPVTTPVPIPAGQVGVLPGVQLAQRPRRRGDTFGWPANAAPSKPEGEVDTRPIIRRGGIA